MGPVTHPTGARSTAQILAAVAMLIAIAVDARADDTRSVFNSKRTMGEALASLIASADARVVVISYNDEAWLTREDLEAMSAARGAVRTLAFDSKRYVGAQIGIHNPDGVRVGEVSHLRNRELVVVAGEPEIVGRLERAAVRG
ncbi:MAG: hypothetical protein WCH13_15955 [Deltaproteobacteria bacterium]